MKLTVLLFGLILGFTTVKAQVFKNDELTITKLDHHLWVIETSDSTCMYIVEGDKKAMLIDTGTQCTNLDQVVRKITKKPLYVVITHMHGDHAGNINYFDDIYFNAADTVLMSRLKKPYTGHMHFVNDGDKFELGNKTIEVRQMPGHTPGSIVLVDKRAGNCFSGDAFGSGQVWLQLKPFSPMAVYIESCKKMIEIMNNGVSRIYCGHYPYIKSALSQSYMDDMYNLAVMIDKGTEPEPRPHPFRNPDVCADNPMMTTLGQATIVYDPEVMRKLKK